MELNGLSVEILKELSYESKLGMSIKKNLHYFDRDILLKELFDMAEWYDEQILLENVALDYRIKSMESITSKYDRYYPIEIQFNTLYDRQLNNWLHDYLYKKAYPNEVGRKLRRLYEKGGIQNEKEFEELDYGKTRKHKNIRRYRNIM